MGSILDFASDFVNVNGFLHGFAVSKKNTWMGPNINFRWHFSWRKCVNMATKDMKEQQIDMFASTNSDCRFGAIAMRKTVVD